MRTVGPNSEHDHKFHASIVKQFENDAAYVNIYPAVSVCRSCACAAADAVATVATVVV